jgi:hypothetical protein
MIGTDTARREPPMDRRHEHVRLLAIFHFVYAGIVVLGSLVPIFWLTVASVWWPELAAEARHDNDLRPAMASGALVAGLIGFGVVLSWLWAALVFFAGRSLIVYRRHTFCLVIAGLACLCIPLGTILGAVSLVILNREETRQLFQDPDTA